MVLVMNSTTLPFTVSEVVSCAASMFSDPAVVTVNVIATFGECVVIRDGTVKLK